MRGWILVGGDTGAHEDVLNALRNGNSITSRRSGALKTDRVFAWRTLAGLALIVALAEVFSGCLPPDPELAGGTESPDGTSDNALPDEVDDVGAADGGAPRDAQLPGVVADASACALFHAGLNCTGASTGSLPTCSAVGLGGTYTICLDTIEPTGRAVAKAVAAGSRWMPTARVCAGAIGSGLAGNPACIRPQSCYAPAGYYDCIAVETDSKCAVWCFDGPAKERVLLTANSPTKRCWCPGYYSSVATWTGEWR